MQKRILFSLRNQALIISIQRKKLSLRDQYQQTQDEKARLLIVATISWSIYSSTKSQLDRAYCSMPPWPADPEYRHFVGEAYPLVQL